MVMMREDYYLGSKSILTWFSDLYPKSSHVDYVDNAVLEGK